MSQQYHTQHWCSIYTNILVTVTPVIRRKSKKKLKTPTTAASHGIFCTALQSFKRKFN